MGQSTAYQFFRKGHPGRVPAWVLRNVGLKWNVPIAWLLDRKKEAKRFIWLKKKRLMRETEKIVPYAACSASRIQNFFPLGLELMEREEDLGNQSRSVGGLG